MQVIFLRKWVSIGILYQMLLGFRERVAPVELRNNWGLGASREGLTAHPKALFGFA